MKANHRFLLAGLLAWLVLVRPAASLRAAEEDGKLDGAWAVQVSQKGTNTAMSSGGIGTLTIKRDGIDWTKIRYLFDKAGKGTIKVDSSQNPPRLTLEDGDRTYKGIYERKKNNLTILLSEASGDYPKEMFQRLPQDFKGVKLVLIAESDKPDGVWQVFIATKGTRYIDTSDTMKLLIKGERIEWTAIPTVFAKAGKGSIEVDSSKTPRRLTIKDGDKVYKGIYKHLGNDLTITLSDPGEDFPKKFDYPPTEKDVKATKIQLREAK